jgi:hypothetical protein
VVKVTTVPGQVSVTVRSANDQGKTVPAAGATVHVGATTVTADDDGRATVTVPAGTHSVHAERTGEIRSFTERIEVG